MLRSKISLSVSAALLLGMVSITGCGTNNAANTGVETKSVKGMHDGRIGVNSVDGGMIRTKTADKMEMSQDLADRIAALSEVRSANVVLLGKSAYVAVTLDEAAAGPHAKSTTRYNTRSYSTPNTYGTGNGPTGMMSGTGRSMTGTTPGTMGGTGTTPGTMGGTGTRSGMMGTTGAMPGTMSGTGTTTGTTGATGTTDVMDGRGMKREIDRGIGKGMDTGMGMGTGLGMGTRSTTPGYNMTATETDTVTKEMKDKIAAEVKKHAPQINAVYVSANADFVQRVNVYAEEARAGHPLKGFAKEFGTMIERIFPTRSDK